MIDWQRIKTVYSQARELPVSEREPFLATECADDTTVRAEVEALLAMREDATERFLDPAPPPSESVLAFQTLGEFELMRQIGRGGMGVVYLAHQPSLDRMVAVKVLVEDATTTPEQVTRFHGEARKAAKLRHPAIAQVYTDGQKGAAHWFAMEWVPGHDLGREIELQRGRRKDGDAILPRFGSTGYATAAVQLVAAIARALAYAHRHGIVHRDVKPGNVILSPSREVKVVDFGVARDDRFGSLTDSGDVMGTLCYMSPEQARVSKFPVDERTDVYSLGVVMFQLLTLRLPYAVESLHDITTRMRTGRGPALRQHNRRIARDLEVVCHKAMEYRPDDRYQDCGELAEDLERFLAHEAIVARPPTVTRRMRQWLRRRRITVALVASVCVTALATNVLADWADAFERRNTMLEQLRGLRTASLADVSTEDLRTAFANHDRLLADPLKLDGDDARMVADVGRAIRDYAAALEQSGRDRIDASRPDRQASGEIDARGFFGGVENIRRAALVLGDDASLLELERDVPFLPRLTARAFASDGSALRGSVFHALLDPITGQPGDFRLVGDLASTAPIEPGPCRIRIDVADRSKEFSRNPVLGQLEERVTWRQSETGRPDDEMVPFPDGGVLEIPAEVGRFFQPLAGRRIEIAPFELDRFEVSIGEYKRFLAATGHEPPAHFDITLARDGVDDLPVSMVSWHDANSYAEWIGKRLPTHAEWVFAALGEQRRPYPWSTDRLDDIRGNVRGSRQEWDAAYDLGQDRGMMERVFFARAVPVNSMPEAATPEGVHHLFGNVAEFLESTCPNGSHPDYSPCVGDRIVIGGMWDAIREDGTLQLEYKKWGMDRSFAFPGYGFRCARSL